MTNTSLHQLGDYGQSLWMDNLNRSLIESGDLKQMIESCGLRGLTSNPAIFQAAIANNPSYDADIKAGLEAGQSASEIYESLIVQDIRAACDTFKPIYESSEGLDGYVSIEVSPHLARDTEGTLKEARRFYQIVDRDNVMIKIPGTPEGFLAVEQAIAEGINVNITLLFSVDSYVQSATAYIRGLERRVKENQPIDQLASVASFFLSRIDTKVDDQIDQRLSQAGTETLNEEARLTEVKGKVAIANAKIAYQKFKEIIASNRWRRLANQGANVQRLLWASTGTKNPDYRDVMYVEELVGPATVNTLPPKTIEACADHCHLLPNQIESAVDKAHNLINSLNDSDINIDLDAIMDELLEEGIDKFVQPHNSLIQVIQGKIDQLSIAA